MHVIGGHQAIGKTISLLAQNYTWYNMLADVVKHIKSCSVCNATNPTFSKYNKYFPTEKGSYPFGIIAMDLITNLPKTKRGNRHIIIAVDAFSKFIELGALPNKSS